MHRRSAVNRVVPQHVCFFPSNSPRPLCGGSKRIVCVVSVSPAPLPPCYRPSSRVCFFSFMHLRKQPCRPLNHVSCYMRHNTTRRLVASGATTARRHRAQTARPCRPWPCAKIAGRWTCAARAPAPTHSASLSPMRCGAALHLRLVPVLGPSTDVRCVASHTASLLSCVLFASQVEPLATYDLIVEPNVVAAKACSVTIPNELHVKEPFDVVFFPRCDVDDLCHRLVRGPVIVLAIVTCLCASPSAACLGRLCVVCLGGVVDAFRDALGNPSWQPSRDRAYVETSMGSLRQTHYADAGARRVVDAMDGSGKPFTGTHTHPHTKTHTRTHMHTSFLPPTHPPFTFHTFPTGRPPLAPWSD